MPERPVCAACGRRITMDERHDYYAIRDLKAETVIYNHVRCPQKAKAK